MTDLPGGCEHAAAFGELGQTLEEAWTLIEAALDAASGADIDEWQTQMQLKPMRIGRVHLYSDGLNDVDDALTGVERVHDLTTAVAESMARHQRAPVGGAEAAAAIAAAAPRTAERSPTRGLTPRGRTRRPSRGRTERSAP